MYIVDHFIYTISTTIGFATQCVKSLDFSTWCQDV